MTLNPILEGTSSFVTDLALCQVRLSHNAKFPWLLLIPRQNNIVEIIDLDESQQAQLMGEISMTSHIMKELFRPDKLNMGALGNVVPQLHIHVIARYVADEAWPNPVWNSGVSDTYSQDAIKTRISQLVAAYDVYK
jgi:diadenosine tetraphosphate (Ap4A) HIT family hydrolase